MLYEHQQKFLKENPDKTALIWSCGTGKTRAAIEWASNANQTLIICPKALKTNWLKEIGRTEVSIYRGTDYFSVMTKEEFRRDFKEIPPFKQIIVDEVHMGFLTPMWKSQMSKALKKYIDIYKVPRILLLSATPYTSSPWNVFNLAYLTGHRWNWQKFKWEFFFDLRMGARIVPMPKKGCEKKLAVLIRKIANVVNIADVMDVPLQQHCDPEYFTLTKVQQAEIRAAYDPLPIVRYTLQHEIENGFLYDESREDIRFFDYDKFDRIRSLCEENDKVAIVCRYNGQINALARDLKEFEPFVIRGDVKDRHAVCEAAESAKRAVVIIQADCVEGYQLPSFGLCIFASMSYSYVKWEQCVGRFLRMDKPSRTTFLYLLTEGESVDQAVYDAVKRKEDFKIELFKKNKK